MEEKNRCIEKKSKRMEENNKCIEKKSKRIEEKNKCVWNRIWTGLDENCGKIKQGWMIKGSVGSFGRNFKKKKREAVKCFTPFLHFWEGLGEFSECGLVWLP